MLRLFCLFSLLLGVTLPGAAFEIRQAAVSPGVVKTSELPPEALATLALIRQGGPYPYDRDGVVFQNFERRLPRAERGYYHEYTVKTPGERTRGARRIIAGGKPPEVYYYTSDHYNTFRRIVE